MGARDIRFSASVKTVTGLTQPPVQWTPASFAEVKRPKRGADHPTPSDSEVRKSRAATL